MRGFAPGASAPGRAAMRETPLPATQGLSTSALTFRRIFDGVQSESGTFSAPSRPRRDSSAFAQSKSGLPTSLGSVRFQAAHFSASGASPVTSRSGSPQMRIARCL